MKHLILLIGALPGISLAALSGTVNLPSGSALAGVTVSLAKTASYGTSVTTSAGKWTLAAPIGISSRTPSLAGPARHLQVREGRLALDFAGNSIDGRLLAGAATPETLADAGRAAGRSAAALDTLVFTLGGSVKARLAVGKLDTTGIVTVIDTASAVVDLGSSTTTWATGCSTAKVACKDGAWTAGGPDPDHTAFKLIKESAHFTIYSDEAISDATATSALTTLENTVWTNMFNSNMLMSEPFCNSATKTKAAIHVHSDWGLTGGGWDATHIGMWIGTGGLSDHWGLTHEFTHSWQAATSDASGMSCNQSNTCGWIHESHANYTPHQLPEYASEVHCSEMLGNAPHVYLGSTRDRYCNWQFMEYLKDKYCPIAVSDIWTRSGADPFTNIQASRGWTVAQLNDFFGDWAMHNVTWDYQKSGAGFRAAYGNIAATDRTERLRRLMPLEALDASWAANRRFVSPFYGAPQRLGYNVVRLYPEAGAMTVSVKFRGVVQAAANPDFRWGLVATNTGFTTARYSKLQSGTDGAITFKVNAGEPLFLVVMATPSRFQTVTWDQDYNTIYRYPYMVELANAWPAGFQGGAKDACPNGLAVHANGGGCAPASTPSTVYVGPYAKVLAGATVTGNARIEDHAIVVNGNVSGGIVGGLAVVGMAGGNNFTVKDNATVRTTFYPLGFFEGSQGVSGTANLYGDVELRGDGTNRSSGNLSGYVDGTSAVSTATDVTAKGPYSWRP